MKNIFNNQVVRRVRDEVNDLRNTSRNTPSMSSTSTYYHHSPSNSSKADSYSHSANSTAGYSQTNTYPVLTEYYQERDTPVSE